MKKSVFILKNTYCFIVVLSTLRVKQKGLKIQKANFQKKKKNTHTMDQKYRLTPAMSAVVCYC